MSRIMRKLGMMVPSDDIILPLSPRSFGAFTFGGGWAMISIIEREIVDKYHWLDEILANALAQSTCACAVEYAHAGAVELYGAGP